MYAERWRRVALGGEDVVGGAGDGGGQVGGGPTALPDCHRARAGGGKAGERDVEACRHSDGLGEPDAAVGRLDLGDGLSGPPHTAKQHLVGQRLLGQVRLRPQYGDVAPHDVLYPDASLAFHPITLLRMTAFFHDDSVRNLNNDGLLAGGETP